MLIDKNATFCEATSVAATAGTALVGSVYDLGVAGRDLGATGEALELVITVDTEVITAGAAGTIQFKLASDAQEAIATDGTATDHIVTASLVTDDAAANSAALNAGGTIYRGQLPSGTYERYLGILCVVGTTEVTAGKINAFLVHDAPASKAYKDGLS